MNVCINFERTDAPPVPKGVRGAHSQISSGTASVNYIAISLLTNELAFLTIDAMARKPRAQYSRAIAIHNACPAGAPIFWRRRNARRFSPTTRPSFPANLRRGLPEDLLEVHAYCLMSNHFHLAIETPHPSLVIGMKWLLGTYTSRFNRRHQQFGHPFNKLPLSFDPLSLKTQLSTQTGAYSRILGSLCKLTDSLMRSERHRASRRLILDDAGLASLKGPALEATSAVANP